MQLCHPILIKYTHLCTSLELVTSRSFSVDEPSLSDPSDSDSGADYHHVAQVGVGQSVNRRGIS